MRLRFCCLRVVLRVFELGGCLRCLSVEGCFECCFKVVWNVALRVVMSVVLKLF